jgi:hypothetical protein
VKFLELREGQCVQIHVGRKPVIIACGSDRAN